MTYTETIIEVIYTKFIARLKQMKMIYTETIIKCNETIIESTCMLYV